MPLPKSKKPLFEATLPSTKQKVYYNQMLVRDEKTLLMAKTSGDVADINRAVKQVVNNCLIDVNVDDLTTFDIEYMYVKIRGVSIGNIVELGFIDKEDEKEYDFEVDLEKVELKYPESVSPIVKVDDSLAIQLRYPPSSLFDDTLAAERSNDSYEFVAAKCIDKIFEDEDTHVADDYTIEELVDWIKDLDTKSYSAVKEFISTTPHLFYEIKYKNSKGTERKITLTTLTDFFTFP